VRPEGRPLLLVAGGLFLTLSCVASPGGQASEKTLPAAVLKAGQQCLPAPETWTATWITSPDRLRNFIARCRSNRIGGAVSTVPMADFGRFGILALEMGRRPSAGYGFDTDNVTAVLEDRRLTVTVAVYQPAPGAVTAQVMTAPWMLIQLPADRFHTLRVIDENARQLAEIETIRP
jgi:hypothetical protein